MPTDPQLGQGDLAAQAASLSGVGEAFAPTTCKRTITLAAASRTVEVLPDDSVLKEHRSYPPPG